MLLVTNDALVFTTDGRYRTQSAEQLERRRRRRHHRSGRHDHRAARRRSPARWIRRHASDSKRTRSPGHNNGRSSETFAGHELVATEGLVERLRRVKEPGEVARIHAACAIADDALAAMLPRLFDGPTEREFALELEVEMRHRGASGNSFDPIVASGPERGQAARAPERAERSSAPSSSSSTSVASSTATAPT